MKNIRVGKQTFVMTEKDEMKMEERNKHVLFETKNK